MSINRLYHTWFQRIRQLRPEERVTRVRAFVWLMVGIHQSRSVHLSRVASKIPGRALLLSTTRRLSRWLDNPAVRVREWYAPIAKEVLAAMASSTGEVRLIADGSCVGFGHQLLILSLAFRRRAIPLTWTWINCPKGHSSAGKQLALLAYVRSLVPKGIPVLRWEIASLGLWLCWNSWTAGNGTMYCGKEPVMEPNWRDKRIGVPSAAWSSVQDRVDGWREPC